MTAPALAVRLATLHESLGFAAERFDGGPSLGGRAAILPSAFNPPTRAHLALLELARDEPDISHVAALLSTNNVDKQVYGAPLAHRLAMLLELSHGRPWLAVVAANAARLADQGLALGAAFPDTQFDFVVGFDTLVRVFDPRYYEDTDAELDAFFAVHRLIAVNRAQATAAAVEEYCSRSPAGRFRDRILVRRLGESHAWMSSSSVRGSIGRGEPTDALTPEVERYIHEHGLYGEA
ncbi:MAG: nicotinate-nicotinamide nucleotide adenylyltransferase [Dehalococcoidia bacterium]